MAHGHERGDYFTQFLNQLPQMFTPERTLNYSVSGLSIIRLKMLKPYKETKRLSYTIKTYSLGIKFKDLPLVSRLGNSLIL